MLNYVVRGKIDDRVTYGVYYGADFDLWGLENFPFESLNQLVNVVDSSKISYEIKDISDLKNIPDNETIINLNWDLQAAKFRRSNSAVSIHGVINLIFCFRIFLNDFKKETRIWPRAKSRVWRNAVQTLEE